MYATVGQIRAASRKLDAIISSPDSDILAWGEEAKMVIDRFCGQDFSFCPRAMYQVRADMYVLNLPQPLSGDVSVVSQTGVIISDPVTTVNSSGVAVTVFGDYWIVPSRPLFLYKNANKNYPPSYDPSNDYPDYINITGDWGYAISQEDLIVRIANEIKAKYQNHRASGTFHQAIDVVNIVSSPDATDLTSAITLLNELKVDISNHFLDLGFHCAVETEAIDSPPATDLATAATLAEDIKHDFNLHIINEPAHECMNLDYINHVYGSTSNPILPASIKRIFIKLVKRLAIRSSIDDELQVNSSYVSETTGDGYTYNLSNGTMRNLLRPEDRELLWPYVNHGRVIA